MSVSALLHHLEAGTDRDETIVFLHGGGMSSRQWAPQFEALGEFHLLAPDLPEQGRSAEVKPFTLEGSAEQVAALIEAKAQGGRAHVVGLSLGGAVGLALMQRYPEKIASLFVTGSAAGLGKFLGGLSLLSAGLYEVLPRRWLIDASVKQFGIPKEYADHFREDLALSANARFTRHFTRALMGMRLPPEASARTLIAVGERETLPAKSAAKRMAREIRGARGVLVPRAGHVWNLEAPALFSETVRRWVTDEALPPELLPLS